MIIILCHPGDAAALWLATTMREQGAGSVELVTVEELVYSRRIVYRLSDAGSSGSIRLADGRTLRPETITGLVNRVFYLPTQHFARALPADRGYAEAELNAFLLAWINGVAGRVINPPHPFALGGGTFARPTLMHFAAVAGLPIEVWRASVTESEGAATPPLPPSHATVVFDGRLFGTLLPRALQDGCRRLAMLTGAPLLQIEFTQSRELGFRFVNASGAVDFRVGGKPLARDLALAFSRSAAA
jgi:hypothetical protein